MRSASGTLSQSRVVSCPDRSVSCLIVRWPSATSRRDADTIQLVGLPGSWPFEAEFDDGGPLHHIRGRRDSARSSRQEFGFDIHQAQVSTRPPRDSAPAWSTNRY